MKPVERFELENIAVSDTFVAHDCADSSNYEIEGGLEEARRVALAPNTRILVYAYNKKAEESGAMSRFILLTEKNLRLYDQWKASA